MSIAKWQRALVLLAMCSVAQADISIPEGTPVYLETTKSIVGKKKETAEGDIVPARVWRDVVVDGAVVIKGGTPAVAKVSAIKSRGIFGIKGKMSIAAVETKTVDGQPIYLTGGYNKEGKGHVGVVVGVGVLLFWPALFVPGEAAKLPSGTVMDSFTIGSPRVTIAKSNSPVQVVNLSGVSATLDAEVLYELLAEEKKPKYFDFRIVVDSDAPDEFVIDKVNGASMEPITLQTLSSEPMDGGKVIRANVEIKPLIKTFKKGINTFEIAYDAGDGRVSDEIILQIEL